MKPWKVFFNGSFWGHRGRDHAGREIPIGRFSGDWLVPAVYLCGKGLVVDVCMRIPAQSIRDFMTKWDLSPENEDPRRFTREQRMRMEAESPFLTNFRPQAVLNSQPLRPSQGCAITWNPCLPQVRDEARDAVEHYGLDPAFGWVISRQSFFWASNPRPELRSLSLTLVPNSTAIPGPHFYVSGPGDQISFRHPATGQTHTLTVREYEHQVLEPAHFEHMQPMEYPTHCIAMAYALSPELPKGSLTVVDCAESDRPKPAGSKAGSSAASIGIIGGADGVTAIVMGSPDQLHSACSALHFEPVEDVEWSMVFHQKQFEDVHMELL